MMKILETIFFILMFLVPGFFIILALVNLKKVKGNKRFRETLIKIILVTAIINGAVWGVLKMTNDKQDITNIDNDTKNYDKNSDESDDDKDGSSGQDSNTDQTPEPPKNDNSTDNNRVDNSTNPPSNDTGTTNSNTSTSMPSYTGVTSNGYKIETIDGVTYVDGYIIANKTYPLPSTYVPTNTYKQVTAANCADCLDKSAIDAYNKMKTDASANGLSLWVASGFRSYSYQTALYNGYVNRSGKAAADTYSARPGHSEHQTGFAFDLNTVTEAFATTREGIWVNENCYKYGFIIRYPKGKDNETGYIYEPWHLRYVGVDLASKLYNGGDWITMETYFGITSQYNS